jgi:hypothetical protein
VNQLLSALFPESEESSEESPQKRAKLTPAVLELFDRGFVVLQLRAIKCTTDLRIAGTLLIESTRTSMFFTICLVGT